MSSLTSVLVLWQQSPMLVPKSTLTTKAAHNHSCPFCVFLSHYPPVQPQHFKSPPLSLSGFYSVMEVWVLSKWVRQLDKLGGRKSFSPRKYFSYGYKYGVTSMNNIFCRYCSDFECVYLSEYIHNCFFKRGSDCC